MEEQKFYDGETLLNSRKRSLEKEKALKKELKLTWFPGTVLHISYRKTGNCKAANLIAIGKYLNLVNGADELIIPNESIVIEKNPALDVRILPNLNARLNEEIRQFRNLSERTTYKDIFLDLVTDRIDVFVNCNISWRFVHPLDKQADLDKQHIKNIDKNIKELESMFEQSKKEMEQLKEKKLEDTKKLTALIEKLDVLDSVASLMQLPEEQKKEIKLCINEGVELDKTSYGDILTKCVKRCKEEDAIATEYTKLKKEETLRKIYSIYPQFKIKDSK